MKSGDVLLISGRSRGVGTATARRAAARAYKVAVNYRDREDAALEVLSAVKLKSHDLKRVLSEGEFMEIAEGVIGKG